MLARFRREQERKQVKQRAVIGVYIHQITVRPHENEGKRITIIGNVSGEVKQKPSTRREREGPLGKCY